MSVTVKHPFVSAVPDSADTSLVRPSNWNADHTIIGLGTAAEKDVGVANGVASLDAGGKVPVSELPAAVLGALSYQGTWNASTNTPTLASGVGDKGYYYVVSVAGSTNLDGITDWLVGDWAVYNGTAWQKVDNTDQVTSVNGLTGAVVLTTTNVAEGTNEYFTTARARASVSAGTGISYDSGTGVITNAAPDQTVSLTDGTAIDVTGTYPNFTINNTAPDQTVVLTAGTGISTSGTYPNFTIANTSPSLGGDVVGPASATDNAVARFDATTGKLLQNSVVLIGDTGSVTGVNALTAESLTVNNNATLGSSNTDTLDVRARILSDLEPNANNAKDIGTSGRNWRDGFFGRTLQTVNLELTGTTSFDGSQGTSGQVLTSAGTGNTPTWTTPTTGTVTSVTGTAPVASSGGAAPAISLNAAYGDTLNPYASKTANFVLAAPTGVAGVPTFRAVVAADIPTLNQNTTGTAAVSTAATITTSATASAFKVPFANTTVSTTGNYGLLQDSTATFTYNPSTNTLTAGTFSGALSGNATTATTLATARNINGTSFNGSANITTANWGTARTLWGQSVNGSANITAPLLPAAGTVALPAFSTSGDTNTGIYFPAADTIGFVEGGVETIRITSAGFVGIGTTAPGARLAVVGTGYSPNIALTDAATIAWNTDLGQTATFTFISTNRTVGAPTNLENGGFYALAVIQNAGSNTLTWNAIFKWAGGTAPTLSTAAGAKDYFTFRSDGTNLYEQGRSLGVA